MRSLTLDELDAASESFDQAAAATGGIDAFCSSSDWAIPAHRAFMPARQPRIHAGEHGYMALMEHTTDDGTHVWLPFEVVWGLGCPLVGEAARPLSREVAQVFEADQRWDVVVLTGVGPDAPLAGALFAALGPHFRIGVAGETTRRCVVDLDRGLEAFLQRRSRNLRRTLLRARERVAAAGISFKDAASEPGATAEGLFARLMSVERRSWKGQEGVGLAVPEMEAFYRAMLPRLFRRGSLLLTFAQHQGVDVGYILGAMFAGAYRGLQFSFDSAYEELGLGNALQLYTMEAAAARGVGLYDLGAEVEYKLRWCDRLIETITVVVRR